MTCFGFLVLLVARDSVTHFWTSSSPAASTENTTANRKESQPVKKFQRADHFSTSLLFKKITNV